jgi:hypothetical protein
MSDIALDIDQILNDDVMRRAFITFRQNEQSSVDNQYGFLVDVREGVDPNTICDNYVGTANVEPLMEKINVGPDLINQIRAAREGNDHQFTNLLIQAADHIKNDMYVDVYPMSETFQNFQNQMN